MNEEQIEKDIEWLLRREEYRVANYLTFWLFVIIMLLGTVSFW